jgi:DNA-directed RNA polymerase subunit RPC12/RpoP
MTCSECGQMVLPDESFVQYIRACVSCGSTRFLVKVSGNVEEWRGIEGTMGA